MKRSIAIRLIPAFLCLLLILGTATVFRACGMQDGGKWMHCHAAQLLIIRCGTAAAVIMTAAAFLRHRLARSVLYGLGAAGCILLFLIPGTLCPLCMMRTMRCRAAMQPFVRIVSALSAVAGFAGMIAAIRSSESA